MGLPFPTLAGRPVSPDETTTKPAATEEATLAPDGSLHQGVQVHGHWVINVADPDGKQVQHHEYENSLIMGGPGQLVGLLSGYLVPGDWMIVLSPNSNPLGACVSTVSVQACGLVHNAATYPAQTICSSVYCTGSSLSYTYNFGTSFAGPYSIVLTGSITANQTGTIATVFSLLNTCANNPYVINTNPMGIETSSPATCAAQTTSAPMPWGGYLTGANITPVNVTGGQLVQVIFTLTFS